MSLYQEYSYNASFCAFHKLLTELLRDFLAEGNSPDHKYLLVSKYLHLSIVDYSEPQSDEDKALYPLTDLVCGESVNTDAVAEIGYKHIILPSKLPETKWEVLIDCMKRDYYKGLFPEVLAPFFKWKLGEFDLEDITIEQVVDMQQYVSDSLDELEEKHPDAYAIHDNFTVDDPWQFTRGFGEDKQMAAYLEYLDSKLADLFIAVS